MKVSKEDLSIEERSGKKHKSKRKKSKCTELIDNNESCDIESQSPQKKRKKKVHIDNEEYKPGMLSDLLQKQKYGCLILPWETSFGRVQPQSDQASVRDGGEQKPKLKMNPLFDTSKRNEDTITSKSSTTYTVFVGNLPGEVSVIEVKKIFKKLAKTIIKIKIRSDNRKNHMSSDDKVVGIKNQYKHATVKFRSLESYESALKMNGKLFKGHHLRITGAEGGTSSDPDKSVFVGNLAVGTSDNDLWKTFENCGKIESVRVIRDKVNKKGIFGYINFQSSESVDEALELDGTSVLEREIRVSRINKNVNSLSNSITVKRKKKKQPKSQLDLSNNAEDNYISNTTVKKKKKSFKSKHKTEIESEETAQPNKAQKKKKKKRLANGTEEN